MRHTTLLTYSQLLIRRAAFAFWRRTVGLAFPTVLVALSSYALYVAVHGRATWALGVLTSVVAFGFLFLITLYAVHCRNGMAKLRGMGQPPVAEFVAEDASFTVRSGMGSASLPWSSIAEVWRFDGFWLLLFSKAQFMTLPLQTLSPDMQAFVLERIRAAGGKIDG